MSASHNQLSFLVHLKQKYKSIMKLVNLVVVLLVVLPKVSSAFTISPRAVVAASSRRHQQTGLQAVVGIYYDSSTGNTETCAGYISAAVGAAVVGVVSPDWIGDARPDEIKNKDALIVGAPTWHTGADTERSGTQWDQWLYKTLPDIDLKDKKVAIFGCGDQQSYADYYCDAAGELYDCFVKAGCIVYGMTSTDGYDHQASKAEVESGKFCGLLFDEDNQYDLSEERAKNWVKQLTKEGFFSKVPAEAVTA
jgi:flavodoxin I